MARDLSLEEYAREVSRTGRRAHLVVSDGKLVGLMRVEVLQAVPREEWPSTSVQAAMIPREKLAWTAPEEPVLSVLERMRSANVDQLAVIREDNVVGLVTRDSILRVVQARVGIRSRHRQLDKISRHACASRGADLAAVLRWLSAPRDRFDRPVARRLGLRVRAILRR